MATNNGTKINLEYFGMPGSGPTVKEAKQDAGRKIEAALEGSYAPFILNHRGRLLIASREPRSGWGYRIFDADQMKPYFTADHCSCGFESRDACLEAAVLHLADITRLKGETDSVLLDYYPIRRQTAVRAEFARRAVQDDEIQERYQRAKIAGLSENDAHDYALRNPARRELWEILPVGASVEIKQPEAEGGAA